MCRIVENFGEDDADGPDLIAVDISAVSDVAPMILADQREKPAIQIGTTVSAG